VLLFTGPFLEFVVSIFDVISVLLDWQYDKKDVATEIFVLPINYCTLNE